MNLSPWVGILCYSLTISTVFDLKFLTPTPIVAQTNYINQLLQLTNAERQGAGLSPLKLSVELNQAAQRHAEDMAKQGLIEHQGSDGSNPIERANQAGYISHYIGENISAGRSSPQVVVETWANNPQHRRNLLDPNYTEVGFGYFELEDSEYRYYWVQLFGKSLDNSAPSPQSSAFPPPEFSECQGSDLLLAANCTDDTLNLEERNLIAKINQYRRQAQLPAIPVSLALTRLANRHVRDLQENGNLYDRRGQDWRFGWSNCSFDGNNPQTFDCMWQAPQRLNTGYLGKGYEIICGGNRPITADIAFNCWQNQVSNQEFLLNQGQWRDYRWKAMGVAIYRNYAVLWLGEQSEIGNSPQPTSNPTPTDRVW